MRPPIHGHLSCFAVATALWVGGWSGFAGGQD
jgi:hypothetical protein